MTGHTACFRWGKKKSRETTFTNFDDILTFLHEQWEALRSKHQLVVGCKGYATLVKDDESLDKLFTGLRGESHVELYVDSKSFGFSYYAKHKNLALARINCSELNMHEGVFDMDKTISDDQYVTMTDIVWADLMRRIRVLNLEQSSEYTMRELISPVLIGALCLVDDNKEFPPTVNLICEKLISGSSGHGPVDYVLSFMNVLIVIGEAKHKDLLQGLYQNLVQQTNALESLTDTLIGIESVGCKRNRDFVEMYARLQSLGTCGITSTGKEWMFSRTYKSSDDNVVMIEKSETFPLTTSSDPAHANMLKREVDTLLRMIVDMVLKQKVAVNKQENLCKPHVQAILSASQMDVQAIVEKAFGNGDDDDLEEEE